MELVEKEERAAKRACNISGVLRILGLSQSGYYRHQRAKQKVTESEKKRIKMKQLILFIYYESKEIYGAPKICAELRKRGYVIAEKTVGNYMRELGIKACYIKSYTKTTIDPCFDEQLKNYLQNNYSPEAPNTVWCSDITYIPTAEGFSYLTSIMDLFSRRIIAWRLSETLEAKWVVECIEEALNKRKGAKPSIFHSDRGSQYISTACLEALDGIRSSYSQKASPWQNACIESFHALIKREWLNRFDIASHSHARRLVFEYIEAFYNTVRSHSHCDYLSPQEFEEKYAEELNKLERRVA